MCRAISVVAGLSLALTGCVQGNGSPESSGLDLSMDHAADYAIIGLVVVGATFHSIMEHDERERALRPKVEMRAPQKAAVNGTIEVEAACRVKGKTVPEWWARNPYTVTVSRESDGAPATPVSEQCRGDGRLILTCRAASPGAYAVEVQTWASGADRDPAGPITARQRVEVQ